jgi:predicted aspartyl protease
MRAGFSLRPSGARVSRRGMLAGGAAFATLPFAGPARGESAPSTNATTSIARAPNLLTIAVTIAGAGPYRFVVDTGADRTVIADDVAAALDLPRGQQASVVGIARTVLAQTVRVPTLAIDNLTKENLDVPVLPRANLGADGYLGLDVIDHHRVSFDFAGRTLTLTPPRSGYLAHIIKPDETVLNAGGSAGRLRAVGCEVDDVRAVAFLDSGADVSVGNTALFDALAEKRMGAIATDTIMLSGVTGGSIAGRSFAVGRIGLGSLDLSTSGLAVADLPIFDLWGLAETPALFIGMDFLRRLSKVTIDYGLKEFRFELASLQPARVARL